MEGLSSKYFGCSPSQIKKRQVEEELKLERYKA